MSQSFGKACEGMRGKNGGVWLQSFLFKQMSEMWWAVLQKLDFLA